VELARWYHRNVMQRFEMMDAPALRFASPVVAAGGGAGGGSMAHTSSF
jgi:hypothetical protein